MTRPRISSEGLAETTVPSCPHCRGRSFGSARISIEQLVLVWAEIGERVPVDPDGYAWIGERSIDCPDCGHPVVLRIDGERITLVAARTNADRRLLERAEA